MKVIQIKGMKFYAHHGWYEIERKIGQEYIVDISCEIDIKNNSVSRLEHTLDYQALYSRVKFNMNQSEKLIETLLDKMGQDLLEQFPIIHKLDLKIKKQPNLGGVIEHICVEGNFKSNTSFKL